jgi:hypothetical protein
MALSFTTSYTFAPNTTIASAQANTNFSDIANVFTGLEAGTKTLSKLKMDTDPATSTEVATKSYVDHLTSYRRPNLVWVSATTVDVESGINGTSGSARVLFPDGDLRTDSTTSRTRFDITRNAALSGTAQSGLRSSLSEGANTIYALYAVKVSDSSANFVTVGDTIAPTQANFTTLNSNFGSNSWVFLGYIFNGSVATQTTDICPFVQSGALMFNRNILATANIPGSGRNKFGARYASTASAGALTTSPSAGSTVGSNYPSTATHLYWTVVCATGTNQVYAGDNLVSTSAGTVVQTIASAAGVEQSSSFWLASVDGCGISNAAGATPAMSIVLQGFYDGALGVGSNPIL